MTDEENIASLLEWLNGLADYHGGPTAERAWASAIRQLMRERDEARQDAEAAWGTITENGYSS